MQPATAPAMEGIDPASAWRLRYWTIFGGQALSLIGSALTQFVLMWWITEQVGTVAALATAGMAALLPQALLGPFGGTFADRYSRRMLMIVADAVSALCMLVLISLFLTDRIELWHLYTMMSIRSAMQAFQAPAAAASVAMLVPTSFLPRAAGLGQSMQGVMAVAAAPLGALAMSAMPLGWALGIDVITALLGIVPLMLFRVPQERAAAHERPGLWPEFKQGVQLVWRHAGLRRLYALLGTTVLVLMPAMMLVPLLVKDYFGGGAAQVALLEGLGGLGMVLGGLLVAALAPLPRMSWVLIGFTLSCVAMGLTALVPSHLFGLAVTWWVVSSLTFIVGNAVLTALLQSSIPNQMQGRALSLLNTAMGLAGPVGLLVATPLGEVIGVRWLFVLAGGLGGLVCAAGFLSPALMEMRPKSTSLRRAEQRTE